MVGTLATYSSTLSASSVLTGRVDAVRAYRKPTPTSAVHNLTRLALHSGTRPLCWTKQNQPVWPTGACVLLGARTRPSLARTASPFVVCSTFPLSRRTWLIASARVAPESKRFGSPWTARMGLLFRAGLGGVLHRLLRRLTARQEVCVLQPSELGTKSS